MTEATRAADCEPGRGPDSHVPTVVVLGDGQLARMLVNAGRRLGVEVIAVPVDAARSAEPGEALRHALAMQPDAVTVEIELVAPELLRSLEGQGLAVRPSVAALALADKAHQRGWMAERGLPVPPFTIAREPADVERFAQRHGWPVVLKRPRGGYDGRGVAVMDRPGPLPFPLGAQADTAGPAGAADQPGSDDSLVVEPLLALEAELAAVVVRSPSDELVAYPVVETVQHEGQCHTVLAPAGVADDVAAGATDLAASIARDAGVVGVLAVELFVTAEGLLVNEVAMRPHNSAHFTIDACVTSQFENHLRAVLDYPLGSCELRSPAAMVNVLGRGPVDPRTRLAVALGARDAHIHLYAKSPRPGRKLGHVTVLDPDVSRARGRAERVVEDLLGCA